MKKLILILIATTISITCFGQTDTIFTFYESIPCTIKEVTPDLVKFNKLGKNVINYVQLHSIYKIVYESGEILNYMNPLFLKNPKGVEDADSVSFTQIESDLLGLYKIGTIYTSFKRRHVVSKYQKTKERAFRNMQIQACILGANVIFIPFEATNHVYYKWFYPTDHKNNTVLSGELYTNQLLNIENFKKVIGEKRKFRVLNEYILKSNSDHISKTETLRELEIKNIVVENGQIIVEGSFEGEFKIKRFNVSYFNDKWFDVYYLKNNTYYCLRLYI